MTCLWYKKVKVNITLVQALRLCTGLTAHRGSRGIALLFHDHDTRRGEGSASRPGRTLPPGKTRYPLYRRLGGPQGRSGQVRKIWPPPGFDPRTVQPVASHYTDWATRLPYGIKCVIIWTVFTVHYSLHRIHVIFKRLVLSVWHLLVVARRSWLADMSGMYRTCRGCCWQRKSEGLWSNAATLIDRSL